MLKGLDVSKYQGVLNFANVKSNFDFVIIKTSEGNGYTDLKFLANQAGFRSVGMLLGYYHFARPDLGNSPLAEANWFLKTVGTLNDGEILCLDYEATWGGDVVGWCKTFLDSIYSKTKCKPLIYLNQSHLKNYSWKPVVEADYGLWLAVYDYDPNKVIAVTQWASVAIKQFSNKLPYGSLAVDANVFYGDATAFKAYGFKGGIIEDNMTQEEANILKFVKELGANEGKVREAFGALADKPSKDKQIQTLQTRVLDLENSQKTLEDRIAEIEAKLVENQKLATDWQKEVVTANKKLDNLSKQNDDLTTEKNKYKAWYEKALTDQVNKYTGWQLIKMGIAKLSVKK